MNSYGRLNPSRDEHPDKINAKKRGGIRLRCVEIKWKAAPLRELCFDAISPQLASEHYIPSDRTYEFSEYAPVGNRKLPRHIRVFEGKTLAADLSAEELSEVRSFEVSSFDRPPGAEWRTWCPYPTLGDHLTPIYNLAIHAVRPVIVYELFGTDGKPHNLHILQSGGAATDAAILRALANERWQPSTCDGVPVEVETVFRR